MDSSKLETMGKRMRTGLKTAILFLVITLLPNCAKKSSGSNSTSSKNNNSTVVATPTPIRQYDASWTPQYNQLSNYLSFTGSAGTAPASGTSLTGLAATTFNYSYSGISAPQIGYVTAPTMQGILFENSVGSSFLDPTNKITFAAGQDFSIVFWMKWSAGDNNFQKRIIAQGDNGCDGYSVRINPDYGTGPVSVGSLYFRLGPTTCADSDRVQIYTTSTFNDLNWHHFAVSVSQSAHIASIYVDGAKQNLAQAPSTCGTILNNNQVDFSACTHATSGVSSWNPSTISGWSGSAYSGFNGALSEFATFNTALSASDVQTIYLRQK